MKEYTLDFLTTTAIKYGTRIFWTAVIVFVGLRVIRMVRTAAGQIMDRAGVEITLKKFLDMLLHAVLFGVMVFMAADQLGIKTTSFVAVLKRSFRRISRRDRSGCSGRCNRISVPQSVICLSHCVGKSCRDLLKPVLFPVL